MKVSSLFFLLLARFASSVSFEGTYVLKEVEDDVGALVDFPTPTKLTLTASDKAGKYTYSLPVKDGNNLWGSGEIDADTGATSLGPTYSTRMGTPYLQLEALLGLIMDHADTTTLTNGVLIVEGSKGSLRLQVPAKRKRKRRQGGKLRGRRNRHS